MKLLHFEELDSTNTYVKNNMHKLEDKTVVYTSHQTSGRGRMERKWVDTGADNIYMTILLKPSDRIEPVYANITQYLSVTLCKVLEDFGVEGQIKWPNDVLVEGRKIAGILSETSMQGENFMGLALGVGINLNTTVESLAEIDKPATSLSVILGKKIDRETFLKLLLEKFFLLYDRFLKEGFILIKDEYVKRSSFLGKEISVNVLGTIHRGVAESITDAGTLVLKKDDEKLTFFIGDIL